MCKMMILPDPQVNMTDITDINRQGSHKDDSTEFLATEWLWSKLLVTQ